MELKRATTFGNFSYLNKVSQEASGDKANSLVKIKGKTMDNIPCVPIISDAEANASEKHTCIRSWQLVSLSPEHYPLLALQPAGGADLRKCEPVVDAADSIERGLLEMFPLEQRAAKSILLKSSEIDAIKSRLATEGPTEENIQTFVSLRKSSWEVSERSLRRGDIDLEIDNIILIRHRVTKRFLAVKRQKTNPDHPPALCFVENSCSINSWFKLSIPATTADFSSAPVRTNNKQITEDTRLVITHPRSGHSLRILDNQVKLGISAAAAIWKIKRRGTRKQFIKPNSCLRLFHDTFSYLMFDNEVLFKSESKSLDSVASLWQIEVAEEKTKDEVKPEGLDSKEELAAHGVTKLQQTQETEKKGTRFSKTVCIGERQNPHVDSQQQIDQKISSFNYFHLKHLLTGKYLTVLAIQDNTEKGPPPKLKRSTSSRNRGFLKSNAEYLLSLTEERGKNTLFSFFHPIAPEKVDVIEIGSFIHLTHLETESWLYTVKTKNDHTPIHRKKKELREKKSLSVHSIGSDDEDLPLIVNMLNSHFDLLRTSVQKFQKSKELSGHTIKSVSKVLGELIKAASVSEDPYSPEALPCPRHQLVLGYHLYVDDLVNMLEIFRDYVSFLKKHLKKEKDRKETSGGVQPPEAPPSKESAIETRIKYVLNICRLIAQLLFLIVKGSKRNNVVVAPYFSRLVKFLGKKVSITDILYEVVKYNEQVVQELTQDDISPFVKLALETKEAMYVSILKAMCSHEGRPIFSNQQVIAHTIKQNQPFNFRLSDKCSQITFSGKKWTDFDQFLGNCKHENEFLWFETILKLLASVCEGFNYKAAYMVSEILPFNVLFSILQAGHLIPVQIRRRVLQILLHVYAPFYSSGSSANNKLMAFSQAQLIVESASDDSSSGSLILHRMGKLMSDDEWTDTKSFLMTSLCQYHEMLQTPPNPMLISVLQLISKLLRRGFFVGSELVSILSNVEAMMLLVNQMVKNASIEWNNGVSVALIHKHIFDKILMQCCNILESMLELNITLSEDLPFDGKLNSILVRLLTSAIPPPLPVEISAIRMLMRNRSYIFGEWWTLFEDSFIPVLEQWGKNKASLYSKKIKELMLLIATLREHVESGKSKENKHKRQLVVKKILTNITRYFNFILPTSIALHLQELISQEQRIPSSTKKIFVRWLLRSPKLNLSCYEHSLRKGKLKLKVVPEELSLCKCLHKLDLGYNELTTIPSEIAELRQLRVLKLNNNFITDIPTEISYLQELAHLDLSNNCLDALPYSVGYMKSLQDLLLLNNPLKEFDQVHRIDKSSTEEILACLRNMAHGTVMCNRIRLVFVGQEKVGKTSLGACLREMCTANLLSKKIHKIKRKRPPSTIATDGINISEWTTKTNKNDILTFSAWDFAGQEVYYSTHQMFLNPHSLYLVVFNLGNDLNSEFAKVDYWLQSIYSRTKESPIMLVGTHSDNKACTKEFLEDVYKQLNNKYSQSVRFRNIKHITFVSAKSGKGIAELLQELMKIAMEQPLMQQPIPKTFIELEKQVRQRQHVYHQLRRPPILDWADFANMALNCGMGTDEIEASCRYLNDLGVIVHFRETASMKDVVILDPQFLTKVMSSIITLQHNFIKNGILRHRDLQLLWKAPELRSCRSLLLSLLQHFEVIFSITPDRSLIPTMLPEQRPASFDKFWTPLVSKTSFCITESKVEYHNSLLHSLAPGSGGHTKVRSLGRTYSFDFVPLGCFGRIIVRLLLVLSVNDAPSTQNIWNLDSVCNGISLRQEEFGSTKNSMSASNQCPMIELLWANGIVLRVSEFEKVLLEFVPEKCELLLFYRYASEKPGKSFVDIATTVSNVISEWYQARMQTDVICPHCLSGDKLVKDCTIFQHSFCEMEFYKGSKFVYCKSIVNPETQSNGSDDKDDETLDLFRGNSQAGQESSADLLCCVTLQELIPEITVTADALNTIPFNDLEIVEKIGSGGFADVYKALWSKTGSREKRLVAVKRIKVLSEKEKAASASEDAVNEYAEFRKEIAAMSGLSHSNIIVLHGICLDPLAMVLDYMADGPLDALLANKSIELTWRMRIKIAMDIARAINFLHSRTPPLIHRDLKSANILMSISESHISCKVADFGSSAVESRLRRRVVDNPVWLAPEVLQGEEYTNKVDVYSFGIILYELLTRSNKLYPFQWWHQVEDWVLAGNRPEIPDYCPPAYRDLMCRCWDRRPHARPPFADITTNLLSLGLLCDKWETHN